MLGSSGRRGSARFKQRQSLMYLLGCIGSLTVSMNSRALTVFFKKKKSSDRAYHGGVKGNSGTGTSYDAFFNGKDE
jgi:hypothetical protein